MNKTLISGLVAALIGTTLMAKDISSYEYGAFKNADDVKTLLQDNGLKIVGEYDAMQNPNYHVIAYTNQTLQNDAAKENRAFSAVEKVMISKSDKQLVFTNPEYFLHAFLQDDYKEADAKKLNTVLTNIFGELKGSKEALSDDAIADYHFMFGMPYYEDMIEVAEGEDLNERIQKNAAKNIVFKIKAGDAMLYGIAMPTEKGEKFYLPKIKGEKHAAFLPYMVMIEDNKAKILHPKYYLAIAFPNLSMGEFMSISETPGDIEEYIRELFKL